MVQPDGDAPVFDQQFVTAAPGVGGRLRVMQHDLSGGMDGRLQPKRDRKRIRTGKMSDAGKREPIVTVQLRRHSVLSFDERRCFVRLSRLDESALLATLLDCM